MQMILIGPPGAGKGTQAERLTKEFQIPQISTGDLFRKNLREGTPLGKKAKEYMDAGKLVPDDVTVAMVEERLQQPDCQNGFILDGFPRTVYQAEALKQVLAKMGKKLTAVVSIEVPWEELMKRLTGRRVCKSCGATFHVYFNPPKVSNVCDQCGGELYQRDDDKAETVEKRLEVYEQQTAPVIDYYKGRGLVIAVDGTKEIDQVFADITAKLRGMAG